MVLFCTYVHCTSCYINTGQCLMIVTETASLGSLGHRSGKDIGVCKCFFLNYLNLLTEKSRGMLISIYIYIFGSRKEVVYLYVLGVEVRIRQK